jgi:hypothetical protein
MQMKINQAEVFTKPIHHLNVPLSAEQLADKTRAFFEEKGFSIVYRKNFSGSELAARDVIKQHYLMYSQAACIAKAEELNLSVDAQDRFFAAYNKVWKDEVAAGRVMGFPQIQEVKGINADELQVLWSEKFSSKQTHKIQDGVLLAHLEGLDCFCINAFYPAMEQNFYNPATEMTYFVVEFDPDRISWTQFRKSILGSTDASKADPESFRGQLYSRDGDRLEYPGRDNFVHGSAGPVEGLIERIVHEPDFDMKTNPVGKYLKTKGISLERFKTWKSHQSISQLGDLFDETEEKNTPEVLEVLDAIEF